MAKIQCDDKTTLPISDMTIDMRVQAVRKIASADKAFMTTTTADASALAAASPTPGKGGPSSDKIPMLLRAAYRNELIETCESDHRVTDPIVYLDAAKREINEAASGLAALL